MLLMNGLRTCYFTLSLGYMPETFKAKFSSQRLVHLIIPCTFTELSHRLAKARMPDSVMPTSCLHALAAIFSNNPGARLSINLVAHRKVHMAFQPFNACILYWISQMFLNLLLDVEKLNSHGIVSLGYGSTAIYGSKTYETHSCCGLCLHEGSCVYFS